MKKNVPLTGKTFVLRLTKLSILLLILLFTITGFHVSGAIKQDVSAKKISIALKDVTLRSALNKISDLADISFVYVNSEALDKSRVSISVQNEQVGVLLKKLLTPHSFTYTVVDDRIIIRHDAEKTSSLDTTPIQLMWGSTFDLITSLMTIDFSENNTTVAILEKITNEPSQ